MRLGEGETYLREKNGGKHSLEKQIEVRGTRTEYLVWKTIIGK
jgi:hypothetical protein